MSLFCQRVLCNFAPRVVPQVLITANFCFMSLIKRKIPKYTLALVLLGICVGLSGYTFYMSRAYSYLSDNPRACVNCHIMAPEYATWFHSAHGRVTTCNDCHVPHGNLLSKYYFKAKDGIRHASMFMLRMEPQVIRIRAEGAEVVQANCVRCHNTLNSKVSTVNMGKEHGQGRYCWDCHREVPHGRVRGLSSAPQARVPLVTSPKPAWLEQLMHNAPAN